MKVLAFAASNSKNSINKQLVQYAGKLLKEKFVKDVAIEILDLNDYELPLFSVDREAELAASPELARKFYEKIGRADALLISYAEHNGSYTAAYKNLYDWTSRIDMKVFQNKPMVLLATSPGPGGAKSVLATATTSAPYFGGDVKASLSIPSFYDAYSMEEGKLIDTELQEKLEQALSTLAS